MRDVILDKMMLTSVVRYGRCGTCPKVLTQYLDLCSCKANQLSRVQARNLHISVINLIKEIICDDLIANCWRGWCLDNSYRPLGAIRQLSESQSERRELLKLESEMRALSLYFL